MFFSPVEREYTKTQKRKAVIWVKEENEHVFNVQLIAKKNDTLARCSQTTLILLDDLLKHL